MAEIRGVLRKCKRATPNTGPNTVILPVITLEKLLLFFFNYSTYAKGFFLLDCIKINDLYYANHLGLPIDTV